MNFAKKLLLLLGEMGYDLADAKRKAQDLAPQISLHILKLTLFPNSPDKKGWLTELNAWREALVRKNIPRGRKRANYSMESLFRYLWEEPLGTSQDLEVALRILRRKGFAVPLEMDADTITKAKAHTHRFIDAILQDDEFE